MRDWTLQRALGWLGLAIAAAGCLGDGETTVGGAPADVLRRRFPERVREVLSTGAALDASGRGFGRADDGGGRLRLTLPPDGGDAIHVELAGAITAEVRELGAGGGGAIVERAVVYPRAGGASFWSARADGYEEWVHLDRGVARRDRAAVTWEIQGASFAQVGEATASIVDEAGTARVWVTAPAAFAPGDVPVPVKLRADGARLELWVDTDGDEVLIDPQWTPTLAMPLPRAFHMAALLQDGRVLLSAGLKDTGPTATATVFDPSTGGWTATNPMIGIHMSPASATLADGTVLAIGGRTCCTFQSAFKDVERYIPATNTWTFVPPMATARVDHTATVLADGRVLVTGGRTTQQFTFGVGSCELFTPATQSWSATGSTSPRYAHTATLLADGRVLVAGGTDANATLSTTALYDPTTGTWASAAPLLAPRAEHTAVRLPDGRVLVAGGWGGSIPAVLATAEIYDPVANSWSAAPSMAQTRRYHAMTSLPDGSVLVTGGVQQSAEWASTPSVFKPTSGTWTSTVDMLAGREFFTLTTLADGRVLAAGGQGAVGAALGVLVSAEIFGPFTQPASLGTACLFATECQSGFCVDGVCCDTACNAGACDACSAALGAVASGTCTPLTGTPCNDGSACTQTDTCQAGTCVGGNAVVCAAPDACHNPGVCDPSTGICSNPAKPNGSPCSDGNGCTQGDTCQAGACSSGPSITCAAPDACHLPGVCAPATGICTNPVKPDGSTCSDGNACTTGDACKAGACVPSTAVTCAPLDACHVAGTCDPLTGLCSNPALPDGVPCDDGDKCTTSDTCQAGSCVGAPTVTCAPLDACHVAGTCDPTTGLCSNPPAPDGSVCDDGDACTIVDRCMGGACEGMSPVTCSASDACHVAGSCDPTTGACTDPVQPDGAPCPGGSCLAGACVPSSSSSSSTSSSGGTSSTSSSSGGTSSTSSSSGGTSSSSGSGGGGGAPASSSGSGGGGGSSPGEPAGCGCSAPGNAPGDARWLLLGLALLARRRRGGMRRRSATR